MKVRIPLLIITLAVIYYCFGYMVVFQASRIHIRIEQSKVEKEADAIQFQFTPEEWRRVKINSNEFQHDGKLFDIVDIKISYDVVMVKAIADEKEMQLLLGLSDIEEKSEQNSEILLSVLTPTFFSDTFFQFPDYYPGSTILNSGFCNPISQFLQCGVFIPPDQVNA